MDQDKSDTTNASKVPDIDVKDRDKIESLLPDGISYEDLIQKDVLELMGFTNLEQSKKDDLHKKIQTTIENRVAARILDMLSEEDQEKYDKIIEVGDSEEGFEFLISRDIDAAEYMAEEMILMKIELLFDAKMVKDHFSELQKVGATETGDDSVSNANEG